MDSPCGKFGGCSFSRFGFIMQTNRHRDAQTDADDRFTPATVISVNNNSTRFNPDVVVVIYSPVKMS